jgi:uncharacterized protein
VSAPNLKPAELQLLRNVFRQHPEVKIVKVFGSRAKGTSAPGSDIDLALWGDIDALGAESIAAELDELPTAYKYDIKPFHLIKLKPLREHIERVGITVYPEEEVTNGSRGN